MKRVVGCAAFAALVISFSSTSLPATSLAGPATGGAAAPPSTVGPLDGTRFEGSRQLERVLAGTPLRIGAKGAGVKRLQVALVHMGFLPHGNSTGYFGPLTQRAVGNFQTHATSALRKSYPATGALDARTLRALAKLAPAKGVRGERGHAPRPFYEGQRLRVVVVKAEHRTFVFNDAGRCVGIYVNAIGRAGQETNSGLRTVSGKLDAAGCAALGRRLWNDATVFGPRLVDLAYTGEELHGTNAPDQLGANVSHGCVRHHNRDIPEIWDRCKVGDRVAIVQTLRDRHLRR